MPEKPVLAPDKIGAALHRSEYTYTADGRDRTSERYIAAALSFASKNQSPGWSLLDVGADYGYAMHLAKTEHGCTRATGVEPYPSSNLWGLDIRLCRVDTLGATEWLGEGDPPQKAADDPFDLLFINHALEHFENPTLALYNLECVSHSRTEMFIAVPDAQSEWAYQKGHLSLWNTRMLVHFCSSRNWEVLETVQQEFRPGFVEDWALFRRR